MTKYKLPIGVEVDTVRLTISEGDKTVPITQIQAEIIVARHSPSGETVGGTLSYLFHTFGRETNRGRLAVSENTIRKSFGHIVMPRRIG